MFTEIIYQPSSLEEVITPNYKKTIEILLNFKDEKKHFIFVGNHLSSKEITMNLYLEHIYKQYNKNYKDYTLKIDVFKDNNYQYLYKELNIFCKSSSKIPKCIFIDNFDNLTEQNQHLFKKIFDKYSSTILIYGCETETKMIDCIKNKMNIIFFEPFTKKENKKLINNILLKEKIKIDNIQELYNYKQLNKFIIYNLFDKLKLLDIKNVKDITIYMDNVYPLNIDTFYIYINEGNRSNSYDIVCNYFEKGYSLLDIYYFLYEHINEKENKDEKDYIYIQKFCYYIQMIYNGYENKLLLLFLIDDLIRINIKKHPIYYNEGIS